MFNSFHLQSECCPNYIIFPSLSCFNRSVIVIDPCRSLYISFLPECLHILLIHCNPFLMSFNLQRSSNVPCSCFLMECFQPCSSSLYSFFQVFYLSRFFGFTHLSKKQLSFTFSPPSSVFPGAILDLGTRSSHSGGVLQRPKTRASDAFQGFQVSSCDLFGSLHSFLHHVHYIMSSCNLFKNSTK